MTDPTDPLEAALSAAWLELEREHGHSSAWPDDTWPSCATVHAVLRQARFALATPRPAGVDVERLLDLSERGKHLEVRDMLRKALGRYPGIKARLALTPDPDSEERT